MTNGYQRLRNILENDECQDLYSEASQTVEQLCELYERYLESLSDAELSNWNTINDLYFLAKCATYRYSRETSISAYRYVYYEITNIWNLYSDLLARCGAKINMDVMGQILTILDTEVIVIKRLVEDHAISTCEESLAELDAIEDTVCAEDLDFQIRYVIGTISKNGVYDDDIQFAISGLETILMALRTIKNYMGLPFYRKEGWY